MRSIRRPVGIACIFSAVALLAFTNPALAQANVTIIDSGVSDELVAPPAPTCNDVVFLTEVTFAADGTPLGIPRFGIGNDLVPSFDLPDFEPIGPSIIALDEVITFDGYASRESTPAQLNERVRFEFLLDGEVQASTPLTPDIPDGMVSAWLDVDMGTYELPNGADAMRIVHFGPGDSPNSVIVSALCGTRVDLPTETTTTTVPDDTVTDDTVTDDTVTDDTVTDDTVCDERVGVNDSVCDDGVTNDSVCDDTVSDDGVTNDSVCDDTVTDDTVTDDGVTETTVPVSVAPTTVAPTTVAPTTAAPAETTTTIAAEVEGTVETRSGDLLAVTGPAHDLGFVLIATGLVLLGSALLLQSKDPEELFS